MSFTSRTLALAGTGIVRLRHRVKQETPAMKGMGT